ncbi:MAG: response regulator [Rickettsiales bacterium]
MSYATAGSGDASGGGQKILIVEDNGLNMKLFRDVLETQGFRVVGTADGNKVCDLVDEEKPDLVLMDIQLSEVSGYDVIERLKGDASSADIPIIAVTAYAMRDDERKVRELGCASYISKPIFIGPFVKEIREVLAKSETERGARVE